MTLLQIQLPESVKAYIDERIAKGGYANPSDYLRALVEADQQDSFREELESKLLAALHEPSTDMTAGDWEIIRRQGRQYLQSRKS